MLDMDSMVGKTSNTCISMAVSDFYAINNHYDTRLTLHTKSSADVVTAVIAAYGLLKDVGVQVIVGPQKSEQAEVVAELGKKAQVPVVSFSASSPSLSHSQMPYFVRMTQNDTYQLEAIASIVQFFEWKEVVLIYEGTDYGHVIIPYFTDAFRRIKVRVSYRSVIAPTAKDEEILEELHKLSTMRTRVFIVHISAPSLGHRFFQKAKEVGLMSEGNVWIITEELTNVLGSLDSSVIDLMRGVLGIKPYIPWSRELDIFRARLTMNAFQENTITGHNLDFYCLRAYDTIWALAIAVEKFCENHGCGESNECRNSTHIAELEKSEMGPELLKEILKSEFNGLSGEILLVDGQLQPTTFQILNVVGTGEREIGFWIPKVGIPHLRPIMWPGEPNIVPNGSVTPTKKLKIGVPVKRSFIEFVRVDLDPSNNGTLVSGYCIDVFDAVLKALPYVVPYELVPFQNPNGESAGDYNELIHQVFLQKYDAVVGDITITANRSSLVDFSHPYTTGGVAMLIPNRYEKSNVFMIFIKPFSKEVWFTVIALVISMISVISYFENVKLYEVAWLLLTASFFASADGLKSVSKIIVIIFLVAFWILLGGIYFDFFVRNLSHRNGQLMEVEVKDLIKNGDYVGYQKDSMVKAVLKQLNFDESKLKAYDSPEEYFNALDKGSKNGGVAAIFDEMPYLKLLMTKHCGKFRRVGSVAGLEGFGFVFPRGSRLIVDISRAILPVLEGGTMLEIENKWLGTESSCLDGSKDKHPDTLSFDDISPLFVIVAILIILVPVVFKLSGTEVPNQINTNDTVQPNVGTSVASTSTDQQVEASKRPKEYVSNMQMNQNETSLASSIELTIA